MSDDRGVDRRQFIIGGAGAIVGAATVAGAVPDSDTGAKQDEVAFRSPAGSMIPFARRDLVALAQPRQFEEPHLAQIAFPLGGIGTGTISLSGRGGFRDWEIFNRPNKNRSLPYTFVALRVRTDGHDPIVHVVEGQAPPPFQGTSGLLLDNTQGPVGLPRFRKARFTGGYPIARVELEDDSVPILVTLEAFTPFIPLETDDSSIPVVIFRYRLDNRSKQTVDATLAFSILNAVGYDGQALLTTNRFEGFGENITRFRTDAGFAGLEMTSRKYPADHLRAGSMALVTTHPTVSAKMAWDSAYPPEQRNDRGPRWDSMQLWFEELRDTGNFKDSREPAPTLDGSSSYGTLAPRVTLRPGEQRSVDFLLTWYFPNRENYWNANTPVQGARLRNHYATRFTDAWAVARHVVDELPRLEGGTRAFHKALFDSTLPAQVVDAVSSQMSIIRTNTGLLLEGKRFFAFEGTLDGAGCCPMNCTHVWNYEQALAHLFPDLERSMRVTDFEVNVNEDGAMAFRTLVPTGDRKGLKFFGQPSQMYPAADGQMGCILKLYREWQLSGDLEFLRRLWPPAKRALEFAWKEWDVDRGGLIEGRQHNTYDIEFFGPNPMIGTLYLGALLAGERMARALGEETAAVEYGRVFEAGRANLDRELWRGGFYIQHVPEAQASTKYQFGEGCLSDQMLGQWFAHVVGLGYLLPPDHVKETVRSIYSHNFKHSFADFPNLHRVYALNDEKGVVLCSWPHGHRPALPFRYSDEVWTGVEYQVAAHLIYEGMVMEGLAIVKGVRDRHDGLRRNPWNETECGSHYARALSSWSLLTAISGYQYSAPDGRLAFAPRVHETDFRCFFTAGTAWGTVALKVSEATTATLSILHGVVTLTEIVLPARGRCAAALNGHRVESTGPGAAAGVVRFVSPARLAAGDVLTLRFSA